MAWKRGLGLYIFIALGGRGCNVLHSWQVWGLTLVSLEKRKQEDYTFESVLGYVKRVCLKKQSNR